MAPATARTVRGLADLREQGDVDDCTSTPAELVADMSPPPLTIGVYRVAEDGTRTTVTPKRAVQPGDDGLYGITAWPLCRCRQCVGEPR